MLMTFLLMKHCYIYSFVMIYSHITVMYLHDLNDIAGPYVLKVYMIAFIYFLKNVSDSLLFVQTGSCLIKPQIHCTRFLSQFWLNLELLLLRDHPVN